VLACVVALLETSAVAADFRQSALTAICYVVPYAVAGAFLISRRPDLPFGWLLAGTAVLSAAGSGAASLAYLAASHGTSTSRWLAFVAFATSSTQFLPVAVQGLINVRFPSGRLSSRWGRALEIALIAGTVLAFIGGVLQDQPLTVVRPGVAPERVLNPLTTGTGVGRIASGLIVLIPVVILLGLVAGLGVVRRAWKATGTERYQLRWRAYGVVLALLLFPLAVTETLPLLVGLLDGLFFVVTLAIPVVRYRLWAIDTVIRRSAAYALVTVAVAGLFAVIAAAGTALASQRTGFILAAAVAAVAFAPARSYSQRLVDRLFYGQRNDPYRALSELGRRLAWSLRWRNPCTCRTWPSSGRPTARCWRRPASSSSRRPPASSDGRSATTGRRSACWSPSPAAASRRSIHGTGPCWMTSPARRARPCTPRRSPPICWTPGNGWSAPGKKNAAGCAATCTTVSARC
jgi:two-component system NarL family sensor kinase